MRNIIFATLAFFFFACQQNANDKASSNETAADTTANVETKEQDATLVVDSIPFDSSQYSFVDDAILLDWRLLSKVKFEEVYNDEVQAYIPYPEFDPIIKALNGKKVIIEGFIIPVEETGEQSILVLSANPFSSCFFCGGAGPESVMDIKLVNPLRLETDQVVQFKGNLRLNDSDLYYLNYILENAEKI